MALKKNIILDFILNGVQVGLKQRNKTATETVRQQIEQTANMAEICEPIKSYEPLNKTSFALQDHVLKTGAVLVFHCDDKIANLSFASNPIASIPCSMAFSIISYMPVTASSGRGKIPPSSNARSCACSGVRKVKLPCEK